MNRDEEYDLLAEEQERMRQFELYRKLCFSVLLKRWRMIVLIFLVTLIGLAAFFQFRFMNSRVRYEARTGLFFYPKQTKRYGAMDAKQTLELFSRLAMRRQVADRLNLGGMDRATLKSRLEINQEKGRPNLIRITVKDAQPEAATCLQTPWRRCASTNTSPSAPTICGIGLKRWRGASGSSRSRWPAARRSSANWSGS